MENYVFIRVERLKFQDLFDWSVPVQKCKSNRVMLSPSKSPRKSGVVKSLNKERGELVRSNERDIALFRYKEQVFAVKEKCPHAGGPLHLGEIEDLGENLLVIKCPWHGWKIDPHNGKVMFPEGHDLQSTAVYPVKVTADGDLFIGFQGLDEGYFKVEECEF